jgi:Na+/H+ antiporter NhaD/arsenite permease-like protein
MNLENTYSMAGLFCTFIFVAAYVVVIFEEKLQIRKSKPVLVASGLIWLVIAAFISPVQGNASIEKALFESFLEFSQLFFFLLVAMTYINAMIALNVFEELKHWLLKRHLSYRKIFWLTGILSFLISPFADNLTTALIMSTVVITVGKDYPKFIGIACINIVVAANAGGAFSPFGDITTLMVWQKGIIPFTDFFKLFVPSLVNFLVPAIIMQLFLNNSYPDASQATYHRIKEGGYVVVGLFIATIAFAVSMHNFLHIPAVFGMMFGLSFIKMFGFYLRTFHPHLEHKAVPIPKKSKRMSFDIFEHVSATEWDTLFFFYGVMMSVGGLGYIGYLELTSGLIYGGLSPTLANSLIGVLSAVIDNIPVMYAVLSMNPNMPEHQWLLVTLTAGVGGSLLSIGSAAGIALMGQAKGYYTFAIHLKWSMVIMLGYIASIWVHLILNG